MAEDKPQELQVILTSEEDGNSAESSGEAGDVTITQNNGIRIVASLYPETESELEEDANTSSGEEEEDLQLQENDAGENDEEIDGKNQQPDRKKDLLETVETDKFHEVHAKLTAKALMNYSDNPLLLAIKIAEKLHVRAKKEKPDKYDFINLAKRVEEFTLRFLDPLKDEEDERKEFFKNSETDLIVKTAIKLEQKKVFSHPVIIDLLTDRWYNVESYRWYDKYLRSDSWYDVDLRSSRWRFFLTMWCLFDMVLFPITYLFTFVGDARRMETGTIEDASSWWDEDHDAVPGWSAGSNDVNQWLEVDLGYPHTKVTGVATQGRNCYDGQWVTKYKLEYSLDGFNYYYYKDPGQSESKEFVGNTDPDTVVYHKLGNAIKASNIRFRPTSWHAHISMRVKVYGCQGTMKNKYLQYFMAPYFIFVRDMISYLALLALHLAICVEPSQLSFSGLEWAILVFVFGRLLTEMKQIVDLLQKRSENGAFCISLQEFKMDYFRDHWNIFDLLILITFICAILPLRIVALTVSGSVTNNRALVIAGYFYGLNTLLLTVRAFGSILETFQGVGTLQIALFHIIRDAFVVVLHFVAITLAFASAITKVFVAEKSLVKEDITGKHLVCNKTGIQCWWKIATHLAWSLLDLSEGLSVLESADYFSETLANLLFAAYLILALILLVNMLIALLSNTYQRVQDNSRNEWVFQKAIRIETYRNYHPIPVPFNIISIILVWIYDLCKKKKVAGTDQTYSRQKDQEEEEEEEKEEEEDQDQEEHKLDPKYLLDKYRLKYGDFLPPTDKLDQVLDDAENTESMVNQVLYRTFTHQQGYDKALLPTGPKAWEFHKAIIVDDYFITREPYVDQYDICGARYKTAFSSRFPHFEIMILETGETKWLGLGVVFEDYETDEFPGWYSGTVGYHTDNREIYDSEHNSPGKKTIGSTAARRGDVIRCTLKFENKQDREGKTQVPVVFSVNGSRILPEDKKDSYLEYSEDRKPFPCIAFHYENSVLAKMCAREDIDYYRQEMKSNLDEVQSNLESKLECVRAEVQTKLQCVQEKLDDVLVKLGKAS